MSRIRQQSKPSAVLLTTNEAWLEALRGPGRDEALQQLRAILVRGLQAVLAQRVPGRAEALAEDFAQEALLKILESLDTFRSESRFTTWAQKIAVRIAFTELRRKRWQDVSLESMTEHVELAPALAIDDTASPAQQAEQHAIFETLRRLIDEALTDKQWMAMTAELGGMPLEEIVRRMDSNVNAVYKLLHDARKRLKRGLETAGYAAEDVKSAFA